MQRPRKTVNDTVEKVQAIFFQEIKTGPNFLEECRPCVSLISTKCSTNRPCCKYNTVKNIK